MNVRAVRFLQKRLKDGPVPSNDVYGDGAKVGLSNGALQRAARYVGAETRKTSYSGHWEWYIPDSDEPVEIKGRQIYPNRRYRLRGVEISGADYIARWRAK